MFVIESWPDPVLADAPRVRASSRPEILVDLARKDLDMIVRTRKVPNDWQQRLQGHQLPAEDLFLDGTLNDILSQLKGSAIRERYPAFMIEDVEQTAARAAAFAVSDRMVLRLTSEQQPEQPFGKAKLRAFCCYGSGQLHWKSGTFNGYDPTSSLSPFDLAFVPSWSGDRVRVSCEASPQAVYLALSVL
ncbi:hypothetical protein [Gluconobacter japonicus]|uniref:hypothetical protein n=1 Tax=Gluconobacter japonicus TaxID=376620 RepID=UPI001B8AE1EF|nr:hypothetical protein [Gluconobacter japonicus]MBS1051084.1 hypothetical protein [Gluconobacter japonicus]